jgi:hypothetical protein
MYPVVAVEVTVDSIFNTRPSGNFPDNIENVVLSVLLTVNGIVTAVLSVTVPRNPADVNHVGAAIFIT